jgi:transposase
LVRETMKADPFSGAVYVFQAKRGDRVKLIYCKRCFQATSLSAGVGG